MNVIILKRESQQWFGISIFFYACYYFIIEFFIRKIEMQIKYNCLLLFYNKSIFEDEIKNKN